MSNSSLPESGIIPLFREHIFIFLHAWINEVIRQRAEYFFKPLSCLANSVRPRNVLYFGGTDDRLTKPNQV